MERVGERKMPLRFCGAPNPPPDADGDDGGATAADVEVNMDAVAVAGDAGDAAAGAPEGAGCARKTVLHLLQRTLMGPACSLSSPTLNRVLQFSHWMITRPRRRCGALRAGREGA